LNLLLRNGRIIDPLSGTDAKLDLLIENGRIVALKERLESRKAPEFDASGLIVAPGFIDLHVHIREPGQEHKEDISSASRAAAKGGFTSICAMPNTRPVNDRREITEYLLNEAKKRSAVNIYPIAAITRDQAGEEIVDMAELVDAGALAFSDDGRCVRNSRLLLRALEQARSLRTLIIEHCEDADLSRDGQIQEGAVSKAFGLKGIPAAAEDVMVARDLILAAAARSRIHIAHLSTSGAVRLVREAKKNQISVTAEATPHHLVLCDTAIKSLDSNFKVNPPLRGVKDLRALRQAVREGWVDVLATDHAPHSEEEKRAGFEQAPFGIAGLETAVSLLLDRLVKRKLISLSRFVEMCSSGPAKILGLKRKGRISVGYDGDLTLLDLHQTITVDVDSFAGKSRNNPFHGWRLKGAPVMTVVGGKIVYPFAE